MYVQRKLFVGRSLGGCNTVTLSPSALLCLEIISRFAFVRTRDSPVSNCPSVPAFYFLNRTLYAKWDYDIIFTYYARLFWTRPREKEKKDRHDVCWSVWKRWRWWYPPARVLRHLHHILKAETVQDANRWKLILEIRELCVYTDMLYSYVHPQLIEFHIKQRIGPMSYRYFGDAFNIDGPAVSTPFQPFYKIRESQ